MNHRLHGVYPPIPTPFTPDGEIAHRKLRENLERWNAFELSGYVVLGSNGEVAYLNEDEKLRTLESARQAIPTHKALIAGTGCESTRQTITLTRQAAELGATAALVVTPNFYDAKMTSASLIQHYQAVADAVPIPVVIYNVPKFTHVDVDARTIVQLSQHPNIIGIKDSGGNVVKLADVVRQVDPAFQFLAGSAGFFLAALTLGAVGGVLALSNIAPQQAIDIYRLSQAGDLAQAAELQRRMVPVNAAVTAGFGVAGLKAALELLGYYGGPVREPLLDITDSERGTLRAILETGGIL